MNYVGKWVFHSIGIMNDDGEMIYMSGEEYLNSPMEYIDETDEEAVADEMNERKQMVGGQLAVCQDGKLYMLLPLPDGVSQAEVDAAVAAGHIKLHDGMITDEPKAWEERNGGLWMEVGIGMSEDGWIQLSDDEGFLRVMTIRYVKAG